MSSHLPVVIDSDDEITVETEEPVKQTPQDKLILSADHVCAAILNENVMQDLLLYGLWYELVRMPILIPGSVLML